MPATKSLQDLFINLLKDMYYVEKQILKALPKMVKKADSDELRQAFEHHLKETEGQVERLEQIFGLCGLKPSAKTCPAIKGILEEGEEDMKEAKEPVVLDDQHDRRRSSGRALRDSALWHVDRVGQSARHERRRAAAPADHRSGV
jgi:Domain of unknown function (DUF892)